MLRVSRRAPAPAAARNARSVKFTPPCSPSVLIDTLAHAKHVRTVHLHIPSPLDAVRVGEALRRAQHMRTLVLHPSSSSSSSSSSPPSSFPIQLLQSLHRHEHLEVLSVVGGGLHGEEGASAVADLVTSCPSLHSLWLGRNALGGEGGSVLASKLAASWKHAQLLSLLSCALPDRPALALAYAAQQMPRMMLLDLRRNPLTAQVHAAFTALKTRHPPLASILRYDPLQPPTTTTTSTPTPPANSTPPP